MRAFGKANVDPGQGAAEAAQATEILLDAIGRSDRTRASVIDELFATKVKNGILGSFSFDRFGDIVPAPVGITDFGIGRSSSKESCARRSTLSEGESLWAAFGASGGGGNRTRVRGRTGQSFYKRSLGFDFTRRPVPRRPTDGLAILKRRTAGDWLSLGAEP